METIAYLLFITLLTVDPTTSVENYTFVRVAQLPTMALCEQTVVPHTQVVDGVRYYNDGKQQGKIVDVYCSPLRRGN